MRRLRLEIDSLQSEICALRLQHEEELRAIRAELETKSTQGPQPVMPQQPAQQVIQPDSQPALQPESQPILQPAMENVVQPATQPEMLATLPPISSSASEKKRKKKRKRKRKTCSLGDSQQQYNDLAQSLGHVVLWLKENSKNICDPQFSNLSNRLPYSPTPKVVPIPSRVKFSPGLHPGVIPLMDIDFN